MLLINYYLLFRYNWFYIYFKQVVKKIKKSKYVIQIPIHNENYKVKVGFSFLGSTSTDQLQVEIV